MGLLQRMRAHQLRDKLLQRVRQERDSGPLRQPRQGQMSSLEQQGQLPEGVPQADAAAHPGPEHDLFCTCEGGCQAAHLYARGGATGCKAGKDLIFVRRY